MNELYRDELKLTQVEIVEKIVMKFAIAKEEAEIKINQYWNE